MENQYWNLCDQQSVDLSFGSAEESKIAMNKTYSRKVFLGGLPPDIDEDGIKASFEDFGAFRVDWPGKNKSKYMFPPKGFAFLYFTKEQSVHRLIEKCLNFDGKLYFFVSSSSIFKLIEVRPWKISDSVTVFDTKVSQEGQYAAFIGGIPRRVTSLELGQTVSGIFGEVSYAAVFLDSAVDYPKGSGVVFFSNHESYFLAMMRKFVCIQFPTENFKVVEFKPFYNISNDAPWNPYVFADQFCHMILDATMSNFQFHHQLCCL